MDRLLELGFSHAADLVIVNGGLSVNIIGNANARNVLYAFVVVNDDDPATWHVRYVGHTRKTFRNRMIGYQNGAGDNTNHRIHVDALSHLNEQRPVRVYCMTDMFNMMMHGLHIDIASGLEYSLIGYYVRYNTDCGHPPLLNRMGNANHVARLGPVEIHENVADGLEEEEDYVPENDANDAPVGQIQYPLSRTYWNYPSINIPREFNDRFGEDGTMVSLIINQNGIERVLNAQVNRRANLNGTPRIYFAGPDGQAFQEWKRQNYNPNDVVTINVLRNGNLGIG